jgi:hypothetical protein
VVIGVSPLLVMPAKAGIHCAAHGFPPSRVKWTPLSGPLGPGLKVEAASS